MRRNWAVAAVVAGIAVIALAVVLARLTTAREGAGPESNQRYVAADVFTDRPLSLADVSGGPLTPESLRERLDDAHAV